MDLHEVELKNGWTLTPSKYGRPALEIATAKRGPNRSPVSIVLPVDCADPSHPAVFIKLSDGSDGQIKSEDDGIPLAAFLCTLEEHDPSADQKAKSTIGQEDEEEEEEEEDEEEEEEGFEESEEGREGGGGRAVVSSSESSSSSSSSLDSLLVLDTSSSMVDTLR